jgi:hypothetical protein
MRGRRNLALGGYATVFTTRKTDKKTANNKWLDYKKVELKEIIF